jgi:hypothetical protein
MKPSSSANAQAARGRSSKSTVPPPSSFVLSDWQPLRVDCDESLDRSTRIARRRSVSFGYSGAMARRREVSA